MRSWEDERFTLDRQRPGANEGAPLLGREARRLQAERRDSRIKPEGQALEQEAERHLDPRQLELGTRRNLLRLAERAARRRKETGPSLRTDPDVTCATAS